MGGQQRVCGTLRSLRNTEWGAFFNIGRDYPDPERFVVVVWDVEILDPAQPGTTVCTTGLIRVHGGATQIELRGPEPIELWE